MSLLEDKELFHRVTLLVKDEDLGLVHSVLGSTVRQLDAVLVDKNNNVVGRAKKQENQQNSQINELIDILKQLVLAPKPLPAPVILAPKVEVAPDAPSNEELLRAGIKPLLKDDKLHKKYEHLTHAQRLLVDYLYMMDDTARPYIDLTKIRDYLESQLAERGGATYSRASTDGQLSDLFKFKFVEKKSLGGKKVGYRITDQAILEHCAAVERSRLRDIGKHFDK